MRGLAEAQKRFDGRMARLPRPWNDLVPVVVYTTGLGGLLGVVLLTFTIIGEASAIGFREATALHAGTWLRSFLLICTFGLAFGAGMALLIGVVFPRLDRLRTSVQNGFFAVLGISFAIFFVFVITKSGRDNAIRDYKRLTAVVGQDQSSPAQMLETQTSALSELSATGAKLLSAFEATEAELRSSRQQLEGALVGLAQHQQAVKSSSDSLRQLANRQELIKVQVGRIQEALGGQQPITRADLERSQWWGQVQGAVVGFVSSLAATYAWTRGARWSRRRQRAQAQSNVE